MSIKINKQSKSIYLDYAATTPVDSAVLRAMEPYWQTNFGNPSSLYKQGVLAHKAVELARADVARILGSLISEVVFTAGGTESINLALFGVARKFSKLLQSKNPPHIITTAIEHHAVLESVVALKKEGFAVTIVGVDQYGFVDIKELQKALRPETILVSVMYANNEVGTIEPIAEIGKWLKQIKDERLQTNGLPIFFHTDACQAAGFLDLNVKSLGVDLMSINGSKVYGPKQTGCLYIKKGTNLLPVVYGGGQEANLRSGTENVPGIVGFSNALTVVQKNKLKENKRLIALRNYFIDRLSKKVSNISLNGPAITNTAKNKLQKYGSNINRLPNNINVLVSGVEGEMAILYLDAKNIAASTGSACSSTNNDPSHVLLAMGKTVLDAKSSVRFTLGKDTTKQQLDEVLKVLPSLIEKLRKIS